MTSAGNWLLNFEVWDPKNCAAAKQIPSIQNRTGLRYSEIQFRMSECHWPRLFNLSIDKHITLYVQSGQCVFPPKTNGLWATPLHFSFGFLLPL